MEISIQDEFVALKKSLAELGIEVIKIVKVGNGSMDFHEMFYRSPRYSETKSVYVQRHQIDELLKRFQDAYV